jgi:hypothetical protein
MNWTVGWPAQLRVLVLATVIGIQLHQCPRDETLRVNGTAALVQDRDLRTAEAYRCLY